MYINPHSPEIEIFPTKLFPRSVQKRKEVMIYTKPKIMLERLLPFAISGVLFGIIYNSLFYPHTLVEYMEASIVGLILGLTSGIIEEFLLKNWFRQRPFSQALLLRTVLYAFMAAISLALILSIEPFLLGECGYSDCFIYYLQDTCFLRDLLFSTLIVFLITFIAQVVLLVGLPNFRRLFLGQFHQPRELYAVFMFVDIRSSTTIAEQLGHQRFSAFLRDFFNDVSPAIYDAKGEIYQYVGDEVIIVWPNGQAYTQNNWLQCYESMKKAIEKKAALYRKKYGVVPEFKAGVHGGLVIASEIGSLQRALVYHGDVLNTTARIQAKCNDLGYDLLASKAMFTEIPSGFRRLFQRIGALPLRGKHKKVTVYGFQPNPIRKPRKLASVANWYG